MEEKEEVMTLEDEDDNEAETTQSQTTTTITFQSKAPEKPITTKVSYSISDGDPLISTNK